MRLWQFEEMADGVGRTWTWRVLGASGNLETTSEQHRNYGAAVTDAIKHGFLPSNDHWVVITSAGVTRFEPTGSTRGHRESGGSQPPRASTDGTGAS